MIRAMRTAAMGMLAQQLNVDVITNNLSNVNTTGFKKSKMEFQDLLYQKLRMAGVTGQVGAEIPVSLEVGYGVRPVATPRIFSQGDLTKTDNPFDVAIDGDGFFLILLPDGSEAFTRDGAFKLSRDGELVTSDGYIVSPSITIPEEAHTVSYTEQGIPEPAEVGTLELVRFINPAGLQSLGRNLYSETNSSGAYTTGVAGEEGFGSIRQGVLELSNVQIVDEMVNLIVAQRAYEINSKAIQTSEEMIQMANNLRR